MYLLLSAHAAPDDAAFLILLSYIVKVNFKSRDICTNRRHFTCKVSAVFFNVSPSFSCILFGLMNYLLHWLPAPAILCPMAPPLAEPLCFHPNILSQSALEEDIFMNAYPVTDAVTYVGVDDPDLTLFEGRIPSSQPA